MKRMVSVSMQKIVMVLLSVMILCVCTTLPVQAANVKQYKVVKGQTIQLKKKNAVWSSRNPSVCSVSSTGQVRALKKGKATIIAKKGKKKYRYKFTVNNAVLNRTSVQVKLKKKVTLKVKGTKLKFRFSSSNPSVVSVSKVKNKRNTVKIKAKKNGIATIRAVYKGVVLTCTVKAGTGPQVNVPKSGTFTLQYGGVPIQTLTYNRSNIAKQVSAVSGYGQSAPLYTSAAGGDGLENIFGLTNNGNVNVPGVKLSDEARRGTIAKACAWARAVVGSKYHGFTFGRSRIMDIFGIPNRTSPGTGDYNCVSLTQCAYYFAGVNLFGECLGNTKAAVYPPFSELVFGHKSISLWGDTKVRSISLDTEHILPKCGFVEITDQWKANKANFVFRAGDIVDTTNHLHEQLVIKDGTATTCEVAEACSPGGGGSKGGDQSGNELKVYHYLFNSKNIIHVFRFTGEGVVLNTAGLTA